MIKINKNTQYVRANNTPRADGLVDVKSSVGKIPVNTDNMTNEFYEKIKISFV